MVAEDPDATWAKIGPHALFDAQTYASWQEGTHTNVTDVHGAHVVGGRARQRRLPGAHAR